ncbi:hypothetical protein [Chromobacterium subtsugae]|uniref:hypothetical protein n=1 Tax=Chromobacterium subtsugae TaxID=251747 RepID=UPI0012D3FF43|nr:hypothetical protein [Chromobacterium subtsugae]
MTALQQGCICDTAIFCKSPTYKRNEFRLYKKHSTENDIIKVNSLITIIIMMEEGLDYSKLPEIHPLERMRFQKMVRGKTKEKGNCSQTYP